MSVFKSLVVVSCLYLSFAAVRDLRASLNLLSPQRYGSLTYGDDVQLRVSIEIREGQLQEDNEGRLCITEIDIYSLYSNLGEGIPLVMNSSYHTNDMCSETSILNLAGWLSGTHNPVVYLRVMENSQQYIVAAIDGVFQTIQAAQLNQPQSNAIVLEDQYQLLDSITLFKTVHSPSTNTSSVVPLTKIIGLDHPISSANRRSHQFPWNSTCINIVFYLKEIQHHGANNRLFHWLFDHARFKENGFCLSVVTGSNNASHNMDVFDKLVNEAGVSVRQYDCLSVDDSMSLNTIHDSLIALNAFFFSDAVQVLIAVNTLGDDNTNHLLFAVNLPLSSEQRESDKAFVFIDLPNLLHNTEWTNLYAVMDGVLAPSRYAGFALSTTTYGKHIAVVYPPACGVEWILQSPCYQQFIDYVDNPVQSVEDARRAKRHVVLSSYSALGSGDVAASHNSAEKQREPVLIGGGVLKNRVRFITANRLDSDKCPALLLLAVQHIRASLSESELSDFDQLARFDLYGGGPLLRSLREMAVALGLQHIVTLKGAVSEAEIMAAMRESDVLINPKIIGETFGFVHTEAAAMGLPVIAFRSGANAESVASGVLVDPHSNSIVEDLAIAIVAYYQKFADSGSESDPTLCTAAKSRIAQWNIRRHSDSLMDAVNNVLSDKSKAL